MFHFRNFQSLASVFQRFLLLFIARFFSDHFLNSLHKNVSTRITCCTDRNFSSQLVINFADFAVLLPQQVRDLKVVPTANIRSIVH